MSTNTAISATLVFELLIDKIGIAVFALSFLGYFGDGRTGREWWQNDVIEE
jgi:hypothetical protein